MAGTGELDSELDDSELDDSDISKSSYYYDTIIRYYISVIMCHNVL